MATARLSDSQKQELVRRFRQGESTQALADQFRCSSTTVTRLVRAELSAEDYAALRDQRQRKTGRDRQIPLAIDSEPGADLAEVAGDPLDPAADRPSLSDEADSSSVTAAAHVDASADDLDEEGDEEAARVEDAHRLEHEDGVEDKAEVVEALGVEEALAVEDELEVTGEGALEVKGRDALTDEAEDALAGEMEGDEESLEPANGGAAVLAIDDADDFANDEDSEDDLLTTDEDEDGTSFNHDFHPVAVLPIAVDDQQETRPAPWSPEVLPSCAYLLVDKTVELQARPLAEIPELGRLASDEQNQQALVLFTNPRQAKRFCGRTQRVIKLPDPALLGRTAPYLRAQGISRIVIEGALYALPEGQ